MGLFKKDPCAICEGKTGMMDKSLADGKICKECVAKMPPWFDDYKNTTAAMMQVNMTLREANSALLDCTEFPVVFGDYGAILICPDEQKFIAVNDLGGGLFSTQPKITCLADVRDLNPQMIKFDQITDMEIDVVELSREDKDAQGESFNSPHFVYSYMFYLQISTSNVLAPFIRIQLNRDAVQIKNEGRRAWSDPGRRIAAHLLDMPALILEDQAAVYNNDELIDWFYHSPYEMPAMSYGFTCTLANWDDIKQYQYYLLMAQRIQSMLQQNDIAC